MAALAVCLRLRQVDLDFAPEEANTATQPFPAGQSVVPSVSLHRADDACPSGNFLINFNSNGHF